MVRWIVVRNIEYYPWVEEFDNYEEAKKCYDEYYSTDLDGNLFLAEVKLEAQNTVK